MAANDFTGQYISSSLLAYTLYRTLPMFAVAFFAAGSLRNAGHVDTWVPLGIATTHVVWTNGVAIWNRRSELGFATVWVFGVISGVFVIGAGTFGGMVARFDGASALLPDVDEIATTLWTAGIAAILGAYLLRITNRPRKDPYDSSRASISDDLWEYAREQANANQADPAVVKAIMVAENLQRPRWLRRIESLKAKLGMDGTYGIMQVGFKEAINDRVSIRKACQSHLSNAQPTRTRSGYAQPESIRDIALAHNPDPKFAELVTVIYWRVDLEESSRRA